MTQTSWTGVKLGEKVLDKDINKSPKNQFLRANKKDPRESFYEP